MLHLVKNEPLRTPVSLRLLGSAFEMWRSALPSQRPATELGGMAPGEPDRPGYTLAQAGWLSSLYRPNDSGSSLSAEGADRPVLP